MRKTLCLAVGIFCCLGFTLVWTEAACAAEKADRAERQKARRSRFKAAPWESLLFFGNEITHVSILLYERDGVPSNRGIAGERPLRYESQDPDFLYMMYCGLYLPLRHAYPDKGKGGMGGGGFLYLLGELTITTEKEEFVVVVTSNGFTLGRSTDLFRHGFFSWGLAKLIDDVLFEQNHVRLPPELFNSLSGESRIAEYKRCYAAFLEKKQERRNADGTDSSSIRVPQAREVQEE